MSGGDRRWSRSRRDGSASVSGTSSEVPVNVVIMRTVRRILGYEMTLAEWIGTALIVGAPYGVIGVLFSIFRADYIAQADGLGKVAAGVGSVVFWPVLLFTDVCPP